MFLEPGNLELEVLAKGCLGIDQRNTSRIENYLIKGFCEAYQKLRAVDMNTNDPKFPFFFHRFSLRDFYHCLRFFRRKSLQLNNRTVAIDPELTLQSLERNFNGVSREEFSIIVETFLNCIKLSVREYNLMGYNYDFEIVNRPFRTQINCLKDSLSDRFREKGNMNDSSVRVIKFLFQLYFQLILLNSSN